MDKGSKHISTKTLEKDGKAVGPNPSEQRTRTKAVSKHELLQGTRDKFYENLKGVYVANKDSKELPPPSKKKPLNDIIKRNM